MALSFANRSPRKRAFPDRSGLCLATVCTSNYLHFAKTLLDSFHRFHPDAGRVLLLADGGGDAPTALDGVTVLTPAQLDIPDFAYMALKYSATDLCCALKPYLLAHVAESAPWEFLLYSDSDVAYFAPATALLEALRAHTFVVTPHTVAPFPEPHRTWERPSLGDLAYAGPMNAGVFGLRVGAKAFEFLQTWRDLVTSPGAFLKTLGGQMEQNTFNWIVSFTDDVHVFRDTAYNVAYWNLHDRALRWRGLDSDDHSDEWTVDGRPLVCFHFSGFSPHEPFRLSRHDHRYATYFMPSLARLVDAYAALLRENGADRYGSAAYRYGAFPSGIPIDDRMRDIFKTHEVFLRSDVDPWTPEGEAHYGRALLSPVAYTGSLIPAYFQGIYDSRQDLQTLTPGAPLEPRHFLQWIADHGVQEHRVVELFDRHRPAWPVPGHLSELALSLQEQPGVLDGLAAPLTSDRQSLIARLLGSGRKELAARLRRYEGEQYFIAPIHAIRSAYEGRSDLQGAFPAPLGADAGPFGSWIATHGTEEQGFPPDFAEAFRRRAGGRALARVFSFVNRTWWLMDGFPLAFCGVRHRDLVRALLDPLRHGVEYDLDDLLVFNWTMDSRPWDGLPLALELAANLRRTPSTRLPEGQEALLGELLTREPNFRSALEDYRRRFSGQFFDEQRALVRADARRTRRPTAVTEVLRDRLPTSGARSATTTPGPDAARREPARPAPDGSRSRGVNVFGYHKSSIGLGMATEGLVLALEAAGRPVARNLVGNIAMTADLVPDDFVQRFDHGFGANLFVSYPHLQDSLLNGLPTWMVEGRKNVVFLAWEQRDGTHYWRDVYREFDQVWALSRFAAASLERTLGRPVLPVPCVLDARSFPKAAPKADVGLPGDRLTFLYAFDANSSIERKNPESVVRAFARAFPAKEDVLLILKVSNAHRLEHRLRLRRLLSEAAELLGDRTSVVTADLSRDGILRLLSAVDCYVSLHRAEGFGYTCAEAMAYGKPVVATRYSGNLDFMNDGNSYLVNAREVLVERPEGPFQRGSVWAEADVDHAASLLREVYRDYPAACRRGERARRDVTTQLSPENVGLIVAKALDS